LGIPAKEGIGGEREGDFTDNFTMCQKCWNFHPKNPLNYKEKKFSEGKIQKY
jgi:hypothetical protein